jgi:hypothetical protein
MINLLQDIQNPARGGGVIVKFDTSSPREPSELARPTGNRGEFPSLQAAPYDQLTAIRERPVTGDHFGAATGNCWRGQSSRDRVPRTGPARSFW